MEIAVVRKDPGPKSVSPLIVLLLTVGIGCGVSARVALVSPVTPLRTKSLVYVLGTRTLAPSGLCQFDLSEYQTAFMTFEVADSAFTEGLVTTGFSLQSDSSAAGAIIEFSKSIECHSTGGWTPTYSAHFRDLNSDVTLALYQAHSISGLRGAIDDDF